MKKSIYVRFVILYAIVAILGFFIVSTLGRELTRDYLERHHADAMYKQASSLSSKNGILALSSSTDLASLYNHLKVTANANGQTIQIITPDGTVLLDTSTALKVENPDIIPNFNPAAFGPKRYQIGTFFATYSEDYLNVMTPLSRGMSVVSYVAIHEPLSAINRLANNMVNTMNIIVAILLFLVLSIFLLFALTIISPLNLIKKGADEFAKGNLSYRIDVPNEDQIGNVAHALNNMADEIKKANEYQRTFISNVSHDFRSPLTSIKGFTEAMTDGTIPPELHGKYLGIIHAEAERLEKLTSNTLSLENLSRSEGVDAILDLKSFDINQVIKSTVSVFEGSCTKRKISFELTLTEDLIVKADGSRIQQVLYNLIDNAVKFSPDNAIIFIETKLKRGKCEISVRDEGIGIPEENLNKIWDRFYKTDASRGKDKKGSGLGLSIVKEIIKLHGETITVSSTENVGTKFVFTLPLGQA
ncbi:MAG: HAMP domain-containing histidine kinase [Lachnospiraceae bacterium]|nr:HAMP domain-containing histidine kinase [Candidatus Equihabitans merdae]